MSASSRQRLTAGGIVLSCGLWASTACAAPNIVMIVSDDQDTASMEIMPTVQKKLVQEGTTFSNAFVSLSLCCPSRSTFLTGQYAHNHGVFDNDMPDGGYPKLDHTKTLAVWLKNSGYHTALMGKYMNKYGDYDTNPNDGLTAMQERPPGWTEWYGIVGKVGYYNYKINENGIVKSYGSAPADYSTDVIAKKADTFLRKSFNKPFFLWVAFKAPHNEGGPFPGPTPAPRHLGKFSQASPPRIPGYNELDVADKPAYIRALLPLTGTLYSNMTTAYQRRLESLLAVDEGVQTIMKALEDTGKLSNTIVIYISDNGWMTGEHRAPGGKVLPYEPSIHVPLVIRGPGFLKERTVSDLVVNTDIAPTIVELAGAGPYVTRVMDGRSLVPLLTGTPTTWRTTFLIESPPTGSLDSSYIDSPGFSGVRTDQYVYLEYLTGERELYDLKRDPYELYNEAQDPAYDSVKTDLQGRLGVLKPCVGGGCWQ